MLGVGSPLRSDDVAGLLAARVLARRFRGRKDLLCLEGGSAPENLTGQIADFKPSHLVVVDCAELDGPPGSVRIFPAELAGGVSSCTHSLPLGIIVDYLRGRCGCEVLLVGMRPKSLEFDGEPSREARRAARLVAAALGRAVRAMGKPGTEAPGPAAGRPARP